MNQKYNNQGFLQDKCSEKYKIYQENIQFSEL